MPREPSVASPHYDDITEEPDEDTAGRTGTWAIVKSQLARLTSFDKSLVGFKPAAPIPLVARLFVAYSDIVKKLDWCWGITYQHQKNEAIRRLLDAATIRLEELKDDLTKLDISEFHYVDNQLIELKLVPRDLEIIPLSAYPVERAAQLQDLAQRLYKGERIYIDQETLEEEEEEYEEEDEVDIMMPFRPKAKKVDPMLAVIQEVVPLIQIHERARIGRLDFLDEQAVFLIRKNVADRKEEPPKEAQEEAAVKIQRIWRGHSVRRNMKERYNKTRMILKMDIPSYRPTEMQDNLKGFDDIKKKRHEDKVKEYIETCLKEKDRVLRIVGPGLMEDITDEIRWWFRSWYDVNKTFDRFPPEEEGGTIIVIRGDTFTAEEYRDEQERIRLEEEAMAANPALAKKKAAEAEKKKREAAKAAKKEKQRIKKEKREAKERAKKGIVEPYVFKESLAHKQMDIADELYEEGWTQRDEELGKDDKLVMERITVDKCYEVQLEMRKIADEMMRLELLQLEAAKLFDKTGVRPTDEKAPKKPPAPKKKKKGKKGKKDLTAHRQVEDLFQELYDQGIIKQYPETDLNSFIGDYGYSNYERRDVDLDPLPGVGEVKQLAINTCIIPLGGENISKPKSVLITGPPQCGKKHLVYAICTATAAVMFDLSAKNLVGKYPGRKGLKMFMHLVSKVSRLLQPSVIFIEGAQQAFYTKVPAEEKKMDAKRLKGSLFKTIVKPITPADRVMLIGTTNQPWAAKARPLIKAYEKFINIPRTDYGTCYQLWMDTLMKYHGIPRDFDCSALAKLSIGYPVPYIREVVQNVLTPKRIIRLKFDPLRQHELLESLMYSGRPEPISQEEQQKFTDWYNKKTKMGKMRTKKVAVAMEARIEAMGGGKKKKK